MRRKSFAARLISSVSLPWRAIRWRWRVADRLPWVVASVVVGVIGGLVFLLYAILTYEDDRRSLQCLALNVYFEARGESNAGKYAVAEVTMNRVASGRYPATVCAVVYQKRWDWIRKRYVSAFSWTEFDSVPSPTGEAWREAWEIAQDVYHGRHTPSVHGALLYHANYIRPSWSLGRQPVARIGKHVFYK